MAESVRRLRRSLADVPPGVRTLGWISFWNDAASELVYVLVPLFLTVTLGAPVAAVGLIEGLGEAASTLLTGPVGGLSDRFGRRRFVVSGYVASSLSKPLIALTSAWVGVLALRLVDRLGKSLRTAPRDALLADLALPGRRGAAFGFHRALDSLGAVVGPLIAVAFLSVSDNLRLWIALAAVPAAISLWLLRRLPTTTPSERPPSARSSLDFRAAGADRRLWWVVGGWVVFNLGNSADAFLILRAHDLGLSFLLVALAYALFNAVYAAASWPAGSLSDRIGRRPVIVVGLVLFALVYAGLAAAGAGWAVWPLFLLYGGYVALTDGVSKALAADVAAPGRTGAAVGLVRASGGLAAMAASIAAGILWDRVGPAAPFALGAVMALAGAAVFAIAPLPHGARANP